MRLLKRWERERGESLEYSPPSDPLRALPGAVRPADLASGAAAVCATAPTATARLRDGADSTARTIRVANTDEWLTRIAVGGAVGITAEATTHDYQSPRERLSQLEVQSARSTVEAARAQLLGADQLRICGFNGTGASAVVDAALAQPIGVDDSRICGLGNAGRWELSSARDGGDAGTPSTGTTTGS